MITFNPLNLTSKLNFSDALYKGTADIFADYEKDIKYIFSGKTAIYILLQYFRTIGAFKNKTSQLLVPPWMGTWVYIMMHKCCFPSLVMNKDIAGIWVYHQYGFPQKMELILDFCDENNLFCIEDCAHALSSFYNGQKLGSFGDAGIFSLAKFFPSVLGGAIYTKNDRIKSFINKSITTDYSELSQKVFNIRHEVEICPTAKNMLKLEQCYAVYDYFSECPDYSLNISKKCIEDKAIEKRKTNYLKIIKELESVSTFYIELPNKNIAPWVCPLFLPLKTMQKATQKLSKNGVECGIYHFDINRNMLNPKYKKCLIVPCHGQINDNQLEKIITTIQSVL